MVLAADVRGEPIALPPIRRSRGQLAALIGVVLAGLIFSGAATILRAHRATADAVLPIEDYSSLYRDSRGLPMGLSLMPSPAEPWWAISKPTRAVRLGARLADLELAAKARNGAATASYYGRDPIANWVVSKNSDLVDRFAGELAAAFGDVAEGRSAAGWYRAIQRKGQDQATIDWSYLHEARKWALDFEPGYLVLGEWLEIGRAAALRRDPSFFARDESRTLLTAALKVPQLPDEARALLGQVQIQTATGTVGDFHALQRALTDALGVLTR